MSRRSRSGARRRRSPDSESKVPEQPPYRQLRNPYRPVEILSADEIEAIHEASLTVLEDIGINFLLPEAREILKAAGADVENNGARVRFDRGLIEQSVSTIPRQFTLHARNPVRNLKFGGDYLNIGSVSSPPNVSDIKRGRRGGNYADYCDFLKLAQSLNIVHMTLGHPVEPLDIEPAIRHLKSTLTRIELTDKPFSGYSLGRERILDVIEMARIARGIDADRLMLEPSLTSNVNANSPLQFDIPMLWGVIEMSRRNQVISITPFTLSGAMAPVTVAGALTQQNAEALAGLAFTQMVKPGAPVIYGGFTSNVDMKTGSPAFGTPENAKATLVGGQLARRYGVPYRSSNVNASNAPDAQAVYESMMVTWAAVMGGANMIYHGCGWLEGGLTASFEKFIIDAEIMQMMASFLEPLGVEPEDLAVEAMRDVGPGGHFFSTQHTLDRYQTAFYKPLLSDWRNYETWSEDGAVDATQRAHAIYRRVVEEYERPPLDEGIREELEAFVAGRVAEGGAPVN